MKIDDEIFLNFSINRWGVVPIGGWVPNYSRNYILVLGTDGLLGHQKTKPIDSGTQYYVVHISPSQSGNVVMPKNPPEKMEPRFTWFTLLLMRS